MKTNLALSVICILAVSFANCSEKKSIHKNEAVARAFIEAWDSHDMNRLNSLFAEEFVYLEVASGRSYSTRDALSNYGNATIAGIPDSKFYVVSVVANEKFAAVEWIWKGTNSVGWDFMGIPATNKYFELPGVSVMEIENQKIKRNSDYWDWNSFMRLIGANP
jgi:steroid delta-isomerase-like uncharacterized protein